MPLNEEEQRILRDIEQRLHEQDPESARRLASMTLGAYLARNSKWAAAGLLVGLVVLVVGFAFSLVLGVFGFLIMLASAVILIQNLRKIGRLGLEQVTKSVGSRNIQGGLGDFSQRLRRRLRGEE